MSKKNISKTVWTVFLITASLTMFFPFILMISTSFKSMAEIQQPRFSILPNTVHLKNYVVAMSRGTWGRYFFNSIYITGITVIAS